MNSDLKFTSDNSYEAIQLKDHIASGAKSEWAVYVDPQHSGSVSYRYDAFEEANAKYESIEDGHYVQLVLYVRIGTSVLFRHKDTRVDK